MAPLRTVQEKDETSRQRYENIDPNNPTDVDRPDTIDEEITDTPPPIDLKDQPITHPDDPRAPEQNETYNADKGPMPLDSEDDPDPTGAKREQDLGDLSDATDKIQN